MSQSTKQLLLAAKAELEKRELSRGHAWRDNKGQPIVIELFSNNPMEDQTIADLKSSVASCCIHGAIRLVELSNEEKDYHARDLIIKVLDLDEDTYPGFIYEWNDHPGRTKQEVLDVLQAAADLAGIMNITQTELDSLEASKSETDWNKACDAIKKARNGYYPPDWWNKVSSSGLMARVAANWGKPDAFELKVD